MPQFQVTLPTHAYPVLIEPRSLRQLGKIVRERVPHSIALLAVDSQIAQTHGTIAQQSLGEHGFRVVVHEFVADERQKSLHAVQDMYSRMLAANVERATPVIALGGGVIGDIAGFAAATYQRGLPFIQVPTTLLAMVDASIGGKTGVNLRRPDGEFAKNMIGAFWQPHAVLIDPEVLRTLDARTLRCGLAECVKHAMIADANLLNFIQRAHARIADLDMNILLELIDRSARIKASIVEKDERESGSRAWLNLGHTFAHAIEPIAELDVRHGEAVAIGLVAAMRCAVRMGMFSTEEEQFTTRILQELHLPVALPHSIHAERLMTAMRHDKKRLGGQLRLILPQALGKVQVVHDVPAHIVQNAWHDVGASGSPVPPSVTT